MTRDVAKEIETLREEIRYHDRKYYVENAPEISDRQYDMLMKRLEALDTSNIARIVVDFHH